MQKHSVLCIYPDMLMACVANQKQAVASPLTQEQVAEGATNTSCAVNVGRYAAQVDEPAHVAARVDFVLERKNRHQLAGDCIRALYMPDRAVMLMITYLSMAEGPPQP